MTYDKTPGRMRGRKLQERRLRVWKDNPCCARCGVLTNYPDGFQLDHKVPLFKGGPDTDANCQVLCLRNGCHEEKTAQDLGNRVRQAIGEDGFPL